MAPAMKFRLKVDPALSLREGQMQEAEIEGLEGGSVLLVQSKGKLHAVGTKCTHYGAPLKNGVVSCENEEKEGRLLCPWHGACFSIATGDVEDAPALDPIATFDLEQKNGSLFVKGDETLLKGGRKTLDIACNSQGSESVVVVGGGSAAAHLIESLRAHSKIPITILTSESYLPYDRPKLSKALIADISKVAWRSPDFYRSSGVTVRNDETVTSIDFNSRLVKTKSGASYPYSKLVLASGGAPRSLPLPGLKAGELGNVFLLRNLAHTQAITSALGQESPKKVVVVGSSFIGLEVANALAGKKHNVHVIGTGSAPAEAVFGAKVGAIFKTLLEKNGVNFHMNASVSHATPSASDGSKVGAVHLKDGTALEADVVVEGVGVAPATEYLKDGSGSVGVPALENDGSLKVSSNFEVQGFESKGVYAVGDIATYPYHGRDVRIEHWNVAGNAGRAVASHISGRSGPPKAFTPVFWSVLGSQLRYCGNSMGVGYDDVILLGETDVKEKAPSWAAFYCKGDDVIAVASMGKDPVVVKCAELMREGRMVRKGDIQGKGIGGVLAAVT